ncbi:MAG: Y-family DNA polymerase [Candidatus Omnitrophica bacterium]|nr:Y-family DNA polymerase [Candidatus Omnitrophota bacterium]
MDCNNFYVSCERVFQPNLNKKPVVVLSNNDGCVISRSQEAKDLGIQMGTPYFKCKEGFKIHGVKAFSSNYTLYADISKRVMETLSGFSSHIEVYSIDEAFLSFDGMCIDLTEYGAKIKKTVYQWTGMPVSVGIAKTKVLAKIANHIAKKQRQCNGVFDLSSLSEDQIDNMLNVFPVEDIWGVGRRYAMMLRQQGIKTALSLKQKDIKWVRKKMTVAGERIVRELRGTKCIEIDTMIKNKKEITCSRSFGKKVSTIKEIKEAVSEYVTRASEKLRHQESVCTGVYVYIATALFSEDRYFKGDLQKLVMPTANTSTIISNAHNIIDNIYVEGKKYAKAGVVLTGIINKTNIHSDLFEVSYQTGSQEKLMSVIDGLNNKMGKGAVSFACNGIDKQWKMSQKLLSNEYTTIWDQLAIVKA